MSTHSTIAINRKDGTRTAIYCQYDGYIEGAGVTLQLAYNTAEKIEELLKLGDLSVLKYNTESCVAYHRDRGEEFSQSDGKNEFNYTFDERDAVWYVEKLNYLRDTPAMKELCLDSFYGYTTTLLLDEISKCDFTDWGADEYASEGGEVIHKCLEKALEARKEIIEDQQRQYEAYYSAYCD